MNIVKYNSFLLSTYIFNSVISLFLKIFSLDNIPVSIIFTLLSLPLILNKVKLSVSLTLIPLLLTAWVIVSLLIVEVPLETINFTVTLIVSFALLPSIVSGLPLNYAKLVLYLKRFSLVNFALLAYMALFRPDLYLDREVMNYMTYGYWMLTSALVFSFLFCYTDSKAMLILSLIAGLFILFFGSRFAIVCYIFGFVGIYAYVKGVTKEFVFLSFLFFVSVLVFILNINSILISILHVTESYGLQPTSLYRLLKIVSSDSSSLSSGRDVLYIISADIISDHPFGVGIYGSYKELLQGNFGLFRYPHNIFIQFLLEFGIPGTVVIILALLTLIYFNLKLIEPYKGWVFVFLLVINTKLLVSSTYLWEPSFWMCLTIGIKNIIDYRYNGNTS